MLKEDLKPCLFIYSDGGPDHRLTYMYMSVQISRILGGIALFSALNPNVPAELHHANLGRKTDVYGQFGNAMCRFERK